MHVVEHDVRLHELHLPIAAADDAAIVTYQMLGWQAPLVGP
jgi:hypothetical protein